METSVMRKVQEYLDDYVGERTLPGAPTFDHRSRRWRVPVLARSSKAVFPVGEFLLDEHGEFLSTPDREQMSRLLDAQIERTAVLVLADKDDGQSGHLPLLFETGRAALELLADPAGNVLAADDRRRHLVLLCERDRPLPYLKQKRRQGQGRGGA